VQRCSEQLTSATKTRLCTITSAEPHYKPLVNNQISSVTIKIGSDIEDEITFGLGKTLAVLHLRQAVDNSKSIVSKWP